jgi:hypothetical protein
MRAMIFLLFTFLLGANSSVAEGLSPNWKEHAVRIDQFNDRRPSALAVVDERLLVAGDRQPELVLFDPGSSSLLDVSRELRIEPGDRISDLWVDRDLRQIWVATNGNGHLANCYDYSLRFIAGHEDANKNQYIRNRFSVWESLDVGGLKGSISTLDFDGSGALFGVFKGGLYLSTLRPGAKPAKVYSPASIYDWPSTTILGGSYGFAGTHDYGLIVVDRNAGRSWRWASGDNREIRGLAILGANLYVSSDSLYAVPLKAITEPGHGRAPIRTGAKH